MTSSEREEDDLCKIFEEKMVIKSQNEQIENSDEEEEVMAKMDFTEDKENVAMNTYKST